MTDRKTEAEHPFSFPRSLLNALPTSNTFNRVTAQSDPFRFGDRERERGGNRPFLTKQYHYFSSLGQECHISQPTTLLQMSIKAQAPPRISPGSAHCCGQTHKIHVCNLCIKSHKRKVYISQLLQYFIFFLNLCFFVMQPCSHISFKNKRCM